MTIVSRDFGLDSRVPMIGFPCHADAIYINKIQKDFSVVTIDGDDIKIYNKLPVIVDVNTDKRVKDVLAYGITENGITQIGLKIKGEFKDIKEVRKLCIELLPSYQIPNHIEIVDEIPKNGSRKKLRK